MPTMRRVSRVIPAGLIVIGLACAACSRARASQASGATADQHAMPEWFNAPCLPESVDTFGWPLYSVMGVEIRVPSAFRREVIPQVDQLYFRRGQATLRLHVQRDASRIFAALAQSHLRQRHCQGEIGRYPAEAISYRDGLLFGFAARWPDAVNGEWLVAVIRARDMADATALREALFTLRFPGDGR